MLLLLPNVPSLLKCCLFNYRLKEKRREKKTGFRLIYFIIILSRLNLERQEPPERRELFVVCPPIETVPFLHPPRPLFLFLFLLLLL